MNPSKTHLDRGWNDPPQFSYSESLEQMKSPKRNILNKRVAFPMNADTLKKNSSSCIDPTAAPYNNPNLPPPPSNSFHVEKSGDENKSAGLNQPSNLEIPCDNVPLSDASDNLPVDVKELLSKLNIVIETKREYLKNNNKEELIRKKLEVMRDCWESDRLSDDVRKRLVDLTNALKADDREKANEIQVALMVDHPKICSEFISAFRQLINAQEIVENTFPVTI